MRKDDHKTIEEFNEEIQDEAKWYRKLPFAGLADKDPPPNRPMLTRIMEQSLVGIIAGIGGAYMTIQITNAVQDEQIKSLQQQLRNTEVRLSEEIKELRAQMYWRTRGE